MNKIKKLLLFTAFTAYLIVLVMILFVRYGVDLSISMDAIRERLHSYTNFTPFHSISNYYRAYSIGNISRTVFVYNIVGNLLLFTPMGYLLPIITRFKKPFRCILILFLLPPAVEAIQLITGLGRFDIDDMILNLTGAIIGFLLYLIFRVKGLVRTKKAKRTQANT